MTILRNKTGGVASLYTVNLAIDVAPDGDVDLSTLVGSVPAASQVEIAANHEIQTAVRSGAWCVVVDGAELSLADSIDAVAAADMRSVDDRAPIVKRGTAVTTAGVDTVLESWPIDEGQRVTVNVQHLDIDVPDFAGLPRGGVSTGLGKAGRVGAAAAVLMGDTFLAAENMAGDRLSFGLTGNTLELRWRDSLGGNMAYELRYFTRIGVSP